MATLEDCKAKFSNFPANAFSNAAPIPVPEGFKISPFGDSERLERIEKRLDAIAELLAALLDSVQDEQEEVETDLDGEITERIKDEQQWL